MNGCYGRIRGIIAACCFRPEHEAPRDSQIGVRELPCNSYSSQVRNDDRRRCSVQIDRGPSGSHSAAREGPGGSRAVIDPGFAFAERDRRLTTRLYGIDAVAAPACGLVDATPNEAFQFHSTACA